MSVSRGKKWAILSGGALLFVLMALLGVYFVEDPLRRYVEDRLNRSFDGYSVTLEGLDLLPVLTVKLHNLKIIQDEHPDPPLVTVSEVTASIHWRTLLSGSLVGDMAIRDPVLSLDMNKINAARKDKGPKKEGGWQKVLTELYPFGINHLEIDKGKITYTEKDDPHPLEMSEVHVVVGNIRNVISPDDAYPSKIEIRAQVFDEGTMEIDGHADFLVEPHVGIKGGIRLTNLDLSNFRPILERSPILLKSGVLASADASLEYAPETKWIQVHSVIVRQLKGRYVYPGRGQEEVKKAAKNTIAKKKKEDDFWILVDQMRVEESTLAFENTTTTPNYRIFMTDMEAEVTNYSNGFQKGDAHIRLKGRFMGSGPTVLAGTFRSEAKGPDFNILLVVEDTKMVDMNNLFRAYGNFDTASGWFSLYSEAKVKNGRMEGYVKPLFRDVDIYDKEQEENDSVFQKIYEGVAGAVAQLLENRPREEVATKTDISGTLKNPKADTSEAMLTLIQNAFFDAILPGFENAL